jgi:CheY-like chemotaxis protein
LIVFREGGISGAPHGSHITTIEGSLSHMPKRDCQKTISGKRKNDKADGFALHLEGVLLELMTMNQPRVLLVDDEASIRDLLRDFLQKRGLTVEGSATAAEALQKLQDQSYDLVILDIALADADGLDVLVTIKQMHPKMPVMMLTGMGYDEELMQEAMMKQAACCISKTQPLHELLQEVRRLIGEGQGPSVPE